MLFKYDNLLLLFNLIRTESSLNIGNKNGIDYLLLFFRIFL